MNKGKVGSLLTHLYEKAVKNINPDNAILKFYTSKEHF